MKVHLSIDQLILFQIDSVLPLFLDYDRKGWIAESIKELLDLDKKRPIQAREILPPPRQSLVHKRMELRLDFKTICRLNSVVSRLKKGKGIISRNLLINEAVRRKLENNGLFLISKSRAWGEKNNEKQVSIMVRLGSDLIFKVKSLVERERKTKQEYFINNWINDAITELLNEEIMGLYSVDHKIKGVGPASKPQCVYLKVPEKTLFEMHNLVCKAKKTFASFSRNKLIFEAVRKKVEKDLWVDRITL